MSIFRGKDGRPTKKSYLSNMSALRVSWLDSLIDLEKSKDILQLRKAAKENIKQIRKIDRLWRISIKQLELKYKHDTIEDYEKILKETQYMLSKAKALKKDIRIRIMNNYYWGNKTLETNDPYYDPYYAKAMAKHIK